MRILESGGVLVGDMVTIAVEVELMKSAEVQNHFKKKKILFL